MSSFIQKMPNIDNINFNYKIKATKVTLNVSGLVIF